MECILVTGGAGFIGSNFVRHVLGATAFRVLVLDSLTYAGNRRTLADVEAAHGASRDDRFTFVEGDIGDRECVDALIERHRPSAIVNFAAETHVDRSIDSPRGFIDTNIVGTFELLESARRYFSKLDPADRRRFRFLHVSTDEVYGSLGPEGLFTEQTPYAPNSPYAASKAAADHLVRAHHETFGLPTLVTNCSNNYGPYQFPEKLIPLMTLNALDGLPLPIYGDGGNVRDWLFVDDHCAGILVALRAGRLGQSYNLGGDNERTNVEIVDTICAILERLRPAKDNPKLKERGVTSYGDLKQFVEDRLGHDRRYAIDAAKAKQELGWSPAHDFASGLEATLRWYLDNRDWCQAVQAGASYDRERLGLAGDGKRG